MARFEEFYKNEVVPKLVEKFGYKSPMEVPAFVKIVLNMGVGEGASDKKIIEAAAIDLGRIAGQKPIVTKARKAIAAFNKLREGSPIGLKVTLRKKRMMEFLDRFITVALPRERDFRGISPRLFDGRGNCTIGIKDHRIFPEIDGLDTKNQGLDICIVTSAVTDGEAKELLTCFKFPFKKN